MSATAEAYDRFQRHGGLIDLSARAKFRLTGADRLRYLNGQVTANIAKIPSARALPACITTAKGRLCGDLFVSAERDALLIDAEPELRESLLARLERYIISDDVAIEDITEHRLFVHLLPPPGQPAPNLTGPNAVDAVTILSELVRPGLDLAPSGTIDSFAAERFGQPGLDLWLPLDAASQPWSEAAAFVAQDLLELLRIERGIPRWGRELTEETLPPEAGLERTHIDYHKGCYIGQEVISRLKSVGHVNRELCGFTSPSGAPLEAGSDLFLPAEPVKPVGRLTSAAWSFALAKPIALGYLKRGVQGDTLLVRPPETGGPGVEVRSCALPFTT